MQLDTRTGKPVEGLRVLSATAVVGTCVLAEQLLSVHEGRMMVGGRREKKEQANQNRGGG